MSYKRVIKPILFKVDPEKAHQFTINIFSKIQSSRLALNLIKKRYTYDDPRLIQNVFGNKFKNPVGLAAGFDKNGIAIETLESFGFGHIEIGGVTPQKQFGNKKPRMWRIPEKEAIVNRLGFNNLGVDKVAENLRSSNLNIPIGVNLGEKNTGEVEEKYVKTSIETIEKLNSKKVNYDWITANVSCPNVGDRSLYKKGNLEEIIDEIDKVTDNIPLLVKIPPDLSEKEIEYISNLSSVKSLDGIIATNTMPTTNIKCNKGKYPEGGLSGRPIQKRSTEVIKKLYSNTKGQIPIIGVGGISSSEAAWEKIINGASLLQIYTGFVYQGPSIVKKINKGIINRMEERNLKNIKNAVGYQIEEA